MVSKKVLSVQNVLQVVSLILITSPPDALPNMHKYLPLHV